MGRKRVKVREEKGKEMGERASLNKFVKQRRLA